MPPQSDKRAINRPVSVLEIIGSSTRGGMENYIRNFIRHLPPDRFKVTCICPNESAFTRDLRELGVEHIFVTPIADDPQWRSIQMAVEVARLHDVDVFHAHMPKAHVLACIAGSLLQKPVVATLHGMHVTAHELGVALAAKSHLIANCQETYIQALSLGVPAERINLFQNGVDINAFHCADIDQPRPALVDLPEGSQLVGFVGRLEFDKGPDLFVRAAGIIHELLPAVHFAVVGDGSMFKDLKKLSKRLNLDDHLHFIDWLQDPSIAYKSFDLLAHSSRNDGTSLVLLEAMACGCPVAGMSVGGVREMIDSEETGMLVDANDWEGLASQIVKLLEKPVLLQTMGAAARKRVEEKFDVLLNTRKAAEVLYKVATLQSKYQTNHNNMTTLATNGIPH